MSNTGTRRWRLINISILLGTVLVVSLMLGVGYETVPELDPRLTVGEPSPEDFDANRTTSEIPDPDKTEDARLAAALDVPAPYVRNTERSQAVIVAIIDLYDQLAEGAFGDPPPPTTTTTTEVPEEEAATENIEETTTTIAGEVEVTIPPETTTTTLPRIDRDIQISTLQTLNPVLEERTVAQFVDLFAKDIDRVAAGELSVFPGMEEISIEWATLELDQGIRIGQDLDDVVAKYLNPLTRPTIAIPGLSPEDLDETRDAMANLVARRLQANESIDQTEWEIQQQAARDDVPEQVTIFRIGDRIAWQGDPLTSVQIEAIQELELYVPDVKTAVPLSAKIIFGIISILVVVFLLTRIAPTNLDKPRRVALIGIILMLAAAASRIPELVAGADHAVGYIIPVVAIGVMTSILFDQRTALLLALPVAAFTAISTGDIAFTLYAGIAASIPVAFVSSVSSRSQLRLSVLGSAVVAAPVAAGLEYLFTPEHTIIAAFQAAGWAFVGAVAGGFVGQGLVSFLENAFGVTTTMSLLDLLDRNHPALQLLEEKAPGTFNHSMLVGSIAGRAARSIGADQLLAQAAAWYHDLGKTEHPQYFVENQLGFNPHDDLTPAESAEIVRGHVTDGLELARHYRIPEEVANGILMHHGTSLMRFFYHKALAEDPEVDPEIYRHHGVKPIRREMAIVMIADATEAAARAYAQNEQPTEEGLIQLVDTIVGEKLEDGQFDDCSLTFGELTTIKGEIVAALSAYYHARVDYPNFPKALSAEGS